MNKIILIIYYIIFLLYYLSLNFTDDNKEESGKTKQLNAILYINIDTLTNGIKAYE